MLSLIQKAWDMWRWKRALADVERKAQLRMDPYHEYREAIDRFERSAVSPEKPALRIVPRETEKPK